jgi:hypothetical protein
MASLTTQALRGAPGQAPAISPQVEKAFYFERIEKRSSMQACLGAINTDKRVNP